MERDIWRVIVAALRRLPRRCSSGQRYTNREVLAVLLWAALHDRSVLWACQRRHWPMQAWRRRLPDQSTMSRRLRCADVLDDLHALVHLVQAAFDDQDNGVLRVDGKALAVSNYSDDPDAANGWGAGQHQRGYKLHALVANAKRLVDFRVEPMNTQESVVAGELLRGAQRAGRVVFAGVVLGDASYDSNPLHALAGACGMLLLAPRRRPETNLSKTRKHHPGRVLSTALLEPHPSLLKWMRDKRSVVEHYFGGLSAAAGLNRLPAWVRTLPRVRVWVAAKLVLNAARIARLHVNVA